MKALASSLALLTFLCPATGTAGGSHQDEQATEVDYCELIGRPETFIGKRIRVRAIYQYFFEIDLLESLKCCPNENRIWVHISPHIEPNSAKLFRKLPKGTGLALVVFVGRFESGTFGTFGDRFQLTVDQIEKVERTSRSSRRQDDPAWVPQGCISNKTQLSAAVTARVEIDGKTVSKPVLVELWSQDGKKIGESPIESGRFLVSLGAISKPVDVRVRVGKRWLIFTEIYPSKFACEWTIGIDTKPFDSENAISLLPGSKAREIWFIEFEPPTKGDGTRVLVLAP